MIDLLELRKRIDGMYTDPYSEEGQEVIHNGLPDEDGRSTHVTEVWEDGEVTVTKSGELYGARNVHQSAKPILPVGFTIFDSREDFEGSEELQEVLYGDKHKRMIVTNKALLGILDEYRKFPLNMEVIDRCIEEGIVDEDYADGY